MKDQDDAQIRSEHSDEAIAERLDRQESHGDLGDVVLGAVDGTITTFAIVSGVAGTELEKGVFVAFVLGLANVIADGFSMGASNYLKARSDLQLIENFRKKEEMHIERYPEFEKEELRQIYARKGFSGDLLEEIVETISKDKKQWVDTMLTDEWGLHLSPISPVRSAVLTFLAFLLTGLIPLMPLLLGFWPTVSSEEIFVLAFLLTTVVLLITGALRGRILQLSVIRSALETLFVGGTAAAIAYFVGHWLGVLLL